MLKSFKKQLESEKEELYELDACDKGISNIMDVLGLLTLKNLHKLTLSHNRIAYIPSDIVVLTNLESLNLFNNYIEEVPPNLSSMPNLKLLNLGMNRLGVLPKGFGAFPKLEVLDLSYNNFHERSFHSDFFKMENLRALYLSVNDFETIPPEIENLQKLQILALRENDLIELPKELGKLHKLRELFIQGNRLTMLPPEMGQLDLAAENRTFRADENPWAPQIADELKQGISNVLEYIKSETYKYLHGRYKQSGVAPPPKTLDKSKKISRKR